MGKTWLQCPAASASQPAPQYFIAGNLDGPAKPNYSCLSGSKPVRSVACLLACWLAGLLSLRRSACLPASRAGRGWDGPILGRGEAVMHSHSLANRGSRLRHDSLYFFISALLSKTCILTTGIIFTLRTIILRLHVPSSGSFCKEVLHV